MIRTNLLPALLTGLILVLVACTGPEDRDDVDPSPTPIEEQAAPVVEATPTADAALEPSATISMTATPTASPMPTNSPTPVPPTATPEPTATPTPLPISLADSLPLESELPGSGYFLANQGTRSALELANSYADPSAHLERLDEWGFKEHRFREYSRESGDGDSLPFYVLTTVNEYGSDDQAATALDWLRSLNSSQGQSFVDPDPELGDGAFASSVQASDGTDTSIVYVQIGPRIYAYFAQGGDPLDFVLELAGSNTAQILDAT